MLSSGCVTISRRHAVPKEGIRVQLESSEEQLLASYNSQVRAVQTLQATVDLIPSTGTTYSGVIEEYHDVPGFILAARPSTVRVIGQAPVVAKNIFDMVSDGREFRIYISDQPRLLDRRANPLRICGRNILSRRCSGRNCCLARTCSSRNLTSP
jgi:hypothetical protein